MNYNDIINYLKDNKADINLNSIEVLKKDTSSNFKDINKFTDLFEDKVERYGIIQSSKKKNISFLSSLLLLIDDEYINLSIKDQIIYVNILKKKILSEVTQKDLFNEIKLKGNGWNKKTLLQLLKEDEINNNYIYYLACYFNINIFIFNLESETINPFYNDEELNKYKVNIFISKFEDIYEPIFYINGLKQFSYNNHIFEKVITSDKIKLINTGFSKKLILKEYKINNNNNVNIPIINSNINDNNVNDSNINENNINNSNINENNINDNIEIMSNSEDYNENEELNTEFSNTNEDNYENKSIEDLLKLSKIDLINICKHMKKPYSNKNKKKLAETIKEKK